MQRLKTAMGCVSVIIYDHKDLKTINHWLLNPRDLCGDLNLRQFGIF